MKVTSLVGRSLVGVACMSLVLGTAAAAEKKIVSKNSRHQQQLPYQSVKPRVVFVEVTGSRIPQRVVLMGQQFNSGSPLYVVQGDELSRTGATSVVGMLSLDPSITSRRTH